MVDARRVYPCWPLRDVWENPSAYPSGFGGKDGTELRCTRKMYERKVLLGTFGDVSKRWVDGFLEMACNESSPAYICGHGVGYIFALSTAFIHAMEDTSDDVLLSEGDRRDIANRVACLDPSVKDALERILEAMEF
jgi:hypothetical protein